tara:strand:- start:1485 stop:2264 length:780 start_codon:yes stop_codon:yes gene_type:complete
MAMTAPEHQLLVDIKQQPTVDQPLCDNQRMVDSDTQAIREAFSARLVEQMDKAGWQARGRAPRLKREIEAAGGKISVQGVHKWLDGTGMPDRLNMQLLCGIFNIQPNYMLYGEFAVGGEIGTYSNATEPGGIPIISYIQAGEFCDAEDPFEPGDADDWLPFRPPSAGPNTYALRVEGESNDPRICDGEIVIIDPDRSPDPGKYVVAKRHSDLKVTLKQLSVSEGEYFLKPGNPKWPDPIIRIDGDWSICGVVIGKYDPM